MRTWLSCALSLALVACEATNFSEPEPVEEGEIVFASNRGGRDFELYRIAVDGSSLRRITSDGAANDLAPAVSPDGARIAWERETQQPGGATISELWVMDASGGNRRAVVANAAENRSPAWTPDGEALIYASRVTGNWEIFRADIATGVTTNLSRDPFADQYPRLSPDGRRIVFHTNRDLDFKIYTMAIDGSDVRAVLRAPGDDRFPTWTPDGSRIIWSRFVDDESRFDLWIMSASGANARALVSSPFAESHAAVSADGRVVVFQSDRIPPFTLFATSIDGGEITAITGRDAPGASDLQPWWSAPRP
jgi:Tol biopolymer transport system component